MGEVKAVADMHQRKAEMARQSDAFIALPGRYKTQSTLIVNIIQTYNFHVQFLNIYSYC